MDEWRGDYSCLKVKLHFTRDKFFYMTTVFIPGAGRGDRSILIADLGTMQGVMLVS